MCLVQTSARGENSMDGENLLVFWKLAVQCRTGALQLHCHHLHDTCVLIGVMLLPFQSTNAKRITTPALSNLNLFFSFLLTSPFPVCSSNLMIHLVYCYV